VPGELGFVAPPPPPADVIFENVELPPLPPLTPTALEPAPEAPTEIGYDCTETGKPANAGAGKFVRNPPPPPPPPPVPPASAPPPPPPATTRYSTVFEPDGVPALDTVKVPGEVKV
jgi:hypothetical protein